MKENKRRSWDLINESTRDSMHKKPAANFLAGEPFYVFFVDAFLLTAFKFMLMSSNRRIEDKHPKL